MSDDADDRATRAAAPPPSGSSDAPRLGPRSASPRSQWVDEDATNQTGWVQGESKAGWVDKRKSQEGWVDKPADDSASSEETVVFDAETVMEEPPARRRLGDFELERKVGQGGMGEVWLARQVSLDRPVAVKVLPRSLANQDNFIERFQREAKAAASLVHPNVLQIYSFGVSEGTPYFAMEFVEGEDLQQRMRRGGGLDWPEMARIMIGVGSALASAHEKGIVHRDIKPSNIMIDRAGQVKVMDFGLAKATTGGNKSLTSAGLIMGTPNYLSPEQGRGDPLDGRSDLYSLGVVLYELLTGQLPFRADTPAGLIFKHVYEPPPAPLELNPEAPPFLVEICLKLLEKDPDDRYTSAHEFLADMTEFFDNAAHYQGGGKRRAGSGAEDKERVANSGAYASAALARRRPPERNAATEEITRPTRAADPGDDEDEPPRRPARRTPPRGPSADDEEARPKSRPITTGTRLPPRRRSRWPLALLLLLAAAGGGGYLASVQYPEEARGLAARYGVELPWLAPAAPAVESVPFMIPPGALAPGVRVALEVPGKRYELRTSEEGVYPVGEYMLELSRKGYIPWRHKVNMKRGDDGRGVLIGENDRDPLRIPVSWGATDELKDAYKDGHSALAQGELQGARKALERAAAFDPEYRPADDQKSAQELLREVQTAIEAAQRTDAQLETELALAREQLEQRQWRAASRQLTKLLDRLPPADRALAEKDLTRCDDKAREGDALRAGVEAELRRGAHAAARAKLDELRATDPGNPKLGEVEARLTEAQRLRALAMADPGADVPGALGRLRTYLETLGPDDKDAQRRLEDLSAQARSQESRARQRAQLRQLAQEDKWQEAHRLALALLREDPEDAEAQRVRSQAETELGRLAITETLRGLDEALVKGSLDDAIRLLDPQSPGAAIERAALADLVQVRARFVSSRHKDLEVRVEGDHAVAVGTWEFAIEVLGEPARKVSAQHRVRLRRVNGGRWLVSEFEVEGEPRAEPSRR
ncbi:MAG: protein kinase [Planctomycetes bacterium]|nr:protein kinase [Planctomycetota bacterium]